MTEPTLEIINA